MRSLSIREARGVLPRLDELVAEHGEIVITRRGKPILRVLAVGSPPPPGPDRNAALRASLPTQRTSSTDVVRADREERG